MSRRSRPGASTRRPTLRRLARRGRSVVVAAAAAAHPGRARLAVLVALGVRRLRGPARRSRLAALRQRRGRRGRAAGRLARGVGAVRGRVGAARADAVPARVAGAEAYANERGIRLIGDIPLYVAGDSCDAFTHPDLFDRSVVAGAAPSQNHPEGQRWGMPVFDWPAHARDGLCLVAGAARARARAVRPAADRPLPRPRQVLGAAARRARTRATAPGAKARASRSSTPPASGSAACR